MNKIYFCGPVNFTGSNIGGGESGNQKTLKILTDSGYDVFLNPKPYPNNKIFLGSVVYFFKMLFYSLNVLKFCLLKNNFNLHVSGFYSHLIYFEVLMICIARFFKKHVVYELRAGGAEYFYYSGGLFYRLFFKLAVKLSSAVLVQGVSYKYFLKEEFNVESIYYPNYIEKKVHDKYLGKQMSVNDGSIRLCYLGRVVKSKNIEMILNVANQLKRDGFLVKLDLIGPCSSDYKVELDAILSDMYISNDVSFIGVLRDESLYNKLQFYHFFVFPTQEKREGHSNALTEAMSCGVVPVVSDVGFNCDVVGSTEFVANDFSVGSFAKIIHTIWIDGCWFEKSKFVRDRVSNNYLDLHVKSQLLASHSNLQGG